VAIPGRHQSEAISRELSTALIAVGVHHAYGFQRISPSCPPRWRRKRRSSIRPSALDIAEPTRDQIFVARMHGTSHADYRHDSADSALPGRGTHRNPTGSEDPLYHRGLTARTALPTCYQNGQFQVALRSDGRVPIAAGCQTCPHTGRIALPVCVEQDRAGVRGLNFLQESQAAGQTGGLLADGVALLVTLSEWGDAPGNRRTRLPAAGDGHVFGERGREAGFEHGLHGPRRRWVVVSQEDAVGAWIQR